MKIRVLKESIIDTIDIDIRAIYKIYTKDKLSMFTTGRELRTAIDNNEKYIWATDNIKDIVNNDIRYGNTILVDTIDKVKLAQKY